MRFAMLIAAGVAACLAVPAQAADTIEANFTATILVNRTLTFDNYTAFWVPSCAGKATCVYQDSYQWPLSGFITATSNDGQFFTATLANPYSGLVSLEGKTYPYFRTGDYTLTIEKNGNAYHITNIDYSLALSSDHFTGTAIGQGIIRSNLAVLPEPGTWTMMIMGFGAMGYGMRRRPRVAFT